MTAIAAVGMSARAQIETLDDYHDDTCIHRTDELRSLPASQLLSPDQLQQPIDLRRVTIGNWRIFNPSQTPADPANQFAGEFVSAESDDRLACVQIQLYGLVNPPGPLGLGGFAYNPMQFGPRPLYGSVELDVDSNRHSGGDLAERAFFRFLGNAARFGNPDSDSVAENSLREWWQLGLNYGDPGRPTYEASGAEFNVVFCGCEELTPVWPPESTIPGAQFVPGSTWVLEGRVFQRASGFRDASQMAWATRPQAAGQYDPTVRFQFSHSELSNRTTVTIVYPTRASGTQILAGLAAIPPYNNTVEEDGNCGSVQEAIRDLATHPNTVTQGTLAYQLTHDLWSLDGQELNELNKVTDWRILSAIVGTAYPQPQGPLSLYVWTDIAPNLDSRGDLTGDSIINGQDRQAVVGFVHAQDLDDGLADCAVTIPGWPLAFSAYDINDDGLVDSADADLLAGGSAICCPSDFNRDGALSVQDIFDFLSAWFSGSADINGDGSTSVQDLFDFLDAYFTGCD